MRSEITGTTLPIVTFTLEPGEGVLAEPDELPEPSARRERAEREHDGAER